jgi:hypothetical protein
MRTSRAALINNPSGAVVLRNTPRSTTEEFGGARHVVIYDVQPLIDGPHSVEFHLSSVVTGTWKLCTNATEWTSAVRMRMLLLLIAKCHGGNPAASQSGTWWIAAQDR